MKKFTILALDKYGAYDPITDIYVVWAKDVYEALDKAELYFVRNHIDFHHLGI